MIRVLFLNPTGDLYGASQSLLRLLSALDRRLVQPLVILPADGPLETALEKQGVRVIIDRDLPVLRRASLAPAALVGHCLDGLRSVRFLTGCVRQHQIDIIHCNSSLLPTGGVVSRLTGKPCVYHVRETHLVARRFLWLVYSRYLWALADCLICVSEAAKSQFNRLARSRASRIYVVPNGLDLGEIDRTLARLHGATFRAELGVRPDEKLVGVIGRISEIKGQDIAVRAFALLPERVRRTARLLLVGDTFPGHEDYLEHVLGLIETLGVSDQVQYCGFRHDIAAVLNSLDVLVLPSYYDAFPGAVVEAMAFRVPVVASRVGGVVEQVVEGVTGLLVTPGDPHQLSEALAVVLEDRHLARQMGAAGRRLVEEKFSIERTARAIEAIYGTLALARS